ncbi:peptidase inhibitor family I36 protein [Cellulomonas hominis]
MTAGLLLLGLGVAPAQAGTGLCDSGYACVYQDLSYDGGLYGSAQNTTSFWGNLKWNDKATSASVNGAGCRSTRFHEHADSRPYGAYFTLNSRQLVGSNYRDPDLRNGAGYDGTGVNWNDRISGFQFVDC